MSGALEVEGQDSRQRVGGEGGVPASGPAAFQVPAMWEYSAPLIAPERRARDPSRAQKDPTVVFEDWRVKETRP